MSQISKIELPDGNKYGIRAGAIPFGEVASTSTSTVFTATIDGITELADGTCVLLKNGVVTSVAGFTLNINGLGAKPVYTNLAAATQDSTIFNINYTMLFVYDSTRVSGGCWICYRGYDSNTNTIGYQLRTNSSTRAAADKGYRYRLWLSSTDNTKWVPINVSTATNATTARTLNTRAINPFGEIIYYNVNGTTNANATLTAANLWEQYTLSIGYSYVLTLTSPGSVYLKCTPQTDGSAVMSTITQSLPTTNDGFIYIYLGRAYSSTNMELVPFHPIYYHDGNGIKIWTGHNFATVATSGSYNDLSNKPTIPTVNDATLTIQKNGTSVGTFTANASAAKTINITVPTKTSDLSNDSGFLTSAVTTFNGQSGAVTYSAPVSSVNGSTGAVVLDASDVGALADDTTYVSSFNGSSGAITYSAPVSSVNSKTGAVTLSASDVGALASNTTYVSSFNGNSGAVTYSAPVASVNGHTGTVKTLVDGDTEDYTPQDVWNAIQAGDNVSINVTSSTYGTLHFTSFNYAHAFRMIISQTIIEYDGAVLDVALTGSLSYGTWSLEVTQLASASSIPTKTSDLTNDSGFLTSAPVSSVNGQTGAVTINVPTVNDATLTIQKNSTSVGTFTANASSNKTINITVPTKTSELTNDSGFITEGASFGGIEMHGVTLEAGNWSSNAQTITITSNAIATSDFLSIPQVDTASEYSGAGVRLASATVGNGTVTLNFICTTTPSSDVSTTVLVSTSEMETETAIREMLQKYPKIQNGKWYTWDITNEVWVDSNLAAGITSITQTTTSTADGGTNVVTATLSDGTTSTFNIKNGTKGSTGAKGDTGETGASAYYYFNNKSVAASDWVSDNTYSNFPYKATITCTNVSSTDGVIVTLNTAEATSGKYAPVANTVTNGVEIWSSTNEALTIPTIAILPAAEGTLPTPSTASQIDYSHASSGLSASNVQEAIDEIASASPSIVEITPTINSTYVEQIGSYCHYAKMEKIVILHMNWKIKSNSGGVELASGFPKPLANICFSMASGGAGYRFWIDTDGVVRSDGATPSSSTWFDGSVTYFTND